MKRVISVTKSQREFLRKAFGVSEQMVCYALHYRAPQGESELAKKICSLALQRGGFVLVSAPESEVVHDAEDMMRQYFENGWMWEGNKRTNVIEVKNPQGVTVERIEDASLRDIEAVQKSMESIYSAKANC